MEFADYKRVPASEIRQALVWVSGILRLKEYEFELEFGTETKNILPIWVTQDNNWQNRLGRSITYIECLEVLVWLHLVLCKERNIHPISVLFHEVLHVFFDSYSHNNFPEQGINVLEIQLFKLWLIHKKRNRGKTT